MLKLIDIKKDYKVADTKVHALKGINLEFRRNEFVCILGPSGCGKTTLLNIIGGLDQYTSGDLEIGGRSTKDFGDRDWDVYRNHQIGFIFQSYNLIPHQTVLGNVELALTIAGIEKEERRERAKQALERVGLGEELGKRPNQLSGGQMQRVAIARALVNNPAILLADEPTGALDSKTSVQIMDLIREISGERLVIMVTHNPELAEQYASRLVCLKDGFVESDSNPYDGAEDRAAEAQKREEELAAPSLRGAGRGKGEKKKKKRDNHAKMSFLTALALSFRNLLTKKGRTIITSIAGSIGIISVCLVLALSSGFNNYIKRTEEDMLSYYPVKITESTYDMAAMMTSFTAQKDMPDLSELDNEVYIDSFLTGLANGMAVKNNITSEYIDYVEKIDPSWVSAIQYGYGARLADNLFTEVDTMEEGGDETDLTLTTRSLSNLKTHYIEVLRTQASQYSQLTYMADFFGNIVNKMPGTTKVGSDDFGKYVLSQYDILEGRFPTNANEIVLVVGKNNQATDLTLAQLGFLNEQKFLSLFELGENQPVADNDDRGYMTVKYSEVVGKQYTLFYNDAVYAENADYRKPTLLSPTAGYPFTYQGVRSTLEASEEQGVNLKISGILRLKEGLTYGCLKSGLNLTEQTMNDYIAHNMSSKIVRWTQDSSAFEFPTGAGSIAMYLSPAAQLDDYYAPLSQYVADNPDLVAFGGLRINMDTEPVERILGGSNVINSVNIYATDFDGKDALLAYLDAWNDTHEEADQITYSDTVGVLMSMMQTILNTITYVLVAFTAISLVVSSVMIGIITYVSVVERVKEIGVLRALGARKRDIRNLFNAETFIIGLTAGLIGIAVTYLLSIVINIVLFSLTGISGIAALPVLTAFVMVIVSVALTLVSGLIPASSAAKKDPVIALRTE